MRRGHLDGYVGRVPAQILSATICRNSGVGVSGFEQWYIGRGSATGAVRFLPIRRRRATRPGRLAADPIRRHQHRQDRPCWRARGR